MAHSTWDQTFLALFDRCAGKYRAGEREPAAFYTAADLAFLAAIGHKTREFFDFVEDWVESASPTPATALLVAAARRDYFIHVQKGVASGREMTPDALPPKTAAVDGIEWLPRILQKARNKLRGENSPDIMYGCAGDRRFLLKYDIHLADFLRLVWSAGDDDAKVVAHVKSRL